MRRRAHRVPVTLLLAAAAGVATALERPADPHGPGVVGPGFRLHVIDANSPFEAAGVLDVDRDGHLDLLSGGTWYRGPRWTRHVVREVSEHNQYRNDFADLPLDVDGDGWTDIVSAAYFDRSIRWIRNTGRPEARFETIVVDRPGAMETAVLVDIDGDGRLDVLPNLVRAPAWHQVTRDATAPHGVRWDKHPLPAEAGGHGIGAGDIDGDGRCDIVARGGWLQQTADPSARWRWQPEFDLGDRPCVPILVHDVDADGDADLLWGPGHGYGVYWLEQGRDPAGARRWLRHTLDTTWSQPHFLLLADLDNDGAADLVTGKRRFAHNGHDPGGHEPLCVYAYHFDRTTRRWTRRVLHEGGTVGFGINTQAVDLDGDGDIDVVAPGKTGLYLLENLLH